MLKQINTAYYQIELLPHYKITPTLMSPPSQQVPKPDHLPFWRLRVHQHATSESSWTPNGWEILRTT